jgi:hypothetical protein
VISKANEVVKFGISGQNITKTPRGRDVISGDKAADKSVSR